MEEDGIYIFVKREWGVDFRLRKSFNSSRIMSFIITTMEKKKKKGDSSFLQRVSCDESDRLHRHCATGNNRNMIL